MSDTPDEVDRLLGRLDRAAVPAELTARVLASTVGQPAPRASRATWLWLAVAASALLSLASTGYLLGLRLASSDGLILLEAVGGDLGLLLGDPGDVLVALSQVVPWELALIAAISVALLVAAPAQLAGRPRRSDGARA